MHFRVEQVQTSNIQTLFFMFTFLLIVPCKRWLLSICGFFIFRVIILSVDFITRAVCFGFYEWSVYIHGSVGYVSMWSTLENDQNIRWWRLHYLGEDQAHTLPYSKHTCMPYPSINKNHRMGICPLSSINWSFWSPFTFVTTLLHAWISPKFTILYQIHTKSMSVSICYCIHIWVTD